MNQSSGFHQNQHNFQGRKLNFLSYIAAAD